MIRYVRALIPALACLAAGLSIACHADQALPSRGLEVSLTATADSPNEVAKEAEKYLQARGLRRIGKSGYDEITGNESTMAFGDPNSVLVSMALDKPGYVLIRVDSNTTVLTREADVLFDELKAYLDRRWPSRTREVP